MNDEPQQAMASERLTEIRARVEGTDEPAVYWNGMSGALEQAEEDRAALLAEVERQWAVITAKEKREAALVDMLQRLIRDADATYVDVRPYAGLGHTKIVGPFPGALEQARALLASAEAGDSGEQAGNKQEQR